MILVIIIMKIDLSAPVFSTVYIHMFFQSTANLVFITL